MNHQYETSFYDMGTLGSIAFNGTVVCGLW